ncbi:type II secretion system protein, partial [Deinococcus antarcticus]
MMNRSGFTLVELLVTILIAGILLVIIAGVVDSSSKLTNKDIGQMNASQNAQGALDMILNDVRNAGENLDTSVGDNFSSISSQPGKSNSQPH